MIKRIIYLAVIGAIFFDAFGSFIFHQSADTLSTIATMINAQKKGVYLRFGDGDVNLANGQSELLQNTNSRLAKEMQEAFALSGEGVLKALPLHCKELGGYEQGMFPGNHEWTYPQCNELLQKVTPFWGNIDEVYAQAALHYVASYDFHTALRFLYFLSDKSYLLVGNKNIPKEMRELLFGKCHFVATPDMQSYREIDRIERECLDLLSLTNDYKVVVVAMGCSGRVLQKRLWQKCNNVFLFDFGSLMDALCGWNTRAWIELSNFDATKMITLLKNRVKILYTAALIDEQYDLRKREYCKNLELLASFHYFPSIAEAVSSGPSFLDEYAPAVFYAKSNDNSVKNKGVNEVRLVRRAIEHFNFTDEDMIVKITGRYYFTDDSFLKTVERNPSIDAFIRYDVYGQVFTGCYAMRAKHIKRFLKSIDIQLMEKQMINIESLLSDFIQTLEHESVNVMRIDQLHLVANIFGTGNCQLTSW